MGAHTVRCVSLHPVSGGNIPSTFWQPVDLQPSAAESPRRPCFPISICQKSLTSPTPERGGGCFELHTHVSVCEYLCRFPQRLEESWWWFPGAGVTGHCGTPMWMLGTQLRSPGRAVNTIKLLSHLSSPCHCVVIVIIVFNYAVVYVAQFIGQLPSMYEVMGSILSPT